MFTWICPKCGMEVPPSYSECPNCAADEKEAAAEQKAAAPAVPAPVASAPARPPANAVSVPWWFLVVLFAIAFVGVGYGVVTWQQHRQQPAPAAAAQPAPIQAVPAGPVLQTDPLFKNVEITGLRLTEDPEKKVYIQFLLVNHSETDLGDLAGNVRLTRSAGKADEQPVGTFAFKTKLGPYESKDLKEPLETKLRVYELPDWQFLRAEISPENGKK